MRAVQIAPIRKPVLRLLSGRLQSREGYAIAARAGMAGAARGRQILDVGLGFWIGRGENIVKTVAGGAVSDALVSGF